MSIWPLKTTKKFDMARIHMVNFDIQEYTKYIYLFSIDRQKYKK